jgi:hypothetical protein
MILLILTDGVIHDKEEVKDLLVQCGRLPLSVIIIGIGNGEDWSAMRELDDDDCQMADRQGNKTQRDLVQFVEFSKHNNNGVELAREVLEELPRQVEEYHTLAKLTPNDYRKNLNPDIIRQQESALR